MTVALAVSLISYYPLWINVPGDIVIKVCEWQQKALPNEVITIISGDEPIEGISKDYNDYDWSNVLS